MLFDANLQVAQCEVAALEDHVQVALVLALGLPMGPDQFVPLPAAVLRYGMSKQAALTQGQEMIDAANDLPDEQPASDLVVASSLQGVEQVAKATEQFKKGK